MAIQRKVQILRIMQPKNNEYQKSRLKILFAIVIISLFVGGGLDYFHYSGTHSRQIMGFTISVPAAVTVIGLIAMIMKPSGKLPCVCLCAFSIPISLMTMFCTYSLAMKRYALGSDFGMIRVIGILPALIIGLIFALIIFFAYGSTVEERTS